MSLRLHQESSDKAEEDNGELRNRPQGQQEDKKDGATEELKVDQ